MGSRLGYRGNMGICRRGTGVEMGGQVGGRVGEWGTGGDR